MGTKLDRELDAMGAAWLFCPADRPERYSKAAARADVVILDLEDAVAQEKKAGAREALISNRIEAGRSIVRIASAKSVDFALDIEAVRKAGYGTVMLSKAEEIPDALRDFDVVALCETPIGVLAAPVLAAQPNVVGLMWGSEDLVASLGGTTSRDSEGKLRDIAMYARSAVLLAARANGIAAIDTVNTELGNFAGLIADAIDAAASGFSATACIHPDQVPVVRKAYTPSQDDLRSAEEMLRRAHHEGGVFQHEGQMVDAPVLRQARALVARANTMTDSTE